MPTPLTGRRGLGVRTDVPPRPAISPRQDPGARPPPALSSMGATFEAASAGGTLKEVSAAKARALEAKFTGGAHATENLSAGRVGASIMGMVVDGELFVRTKAVRPGVTPKWQAAGSLQAADAPQPKPRARTEDAAKPEGWGPKPKSLEARVQQVVAERMGLMSNPDFALKGSELREFKKAIAAGEVQQVNASPRGLAGVSLTGYVAENMLIVEKKAVRPGATSQFFILGPLG